MDKSKPKKHKVEKGDGVGKEVCIMCTQRTHGQRVEEDYVISAIRWVKKRLNAEKGNTLVVCDKCMDSYKKRRGEFERSLLMYGGAGIVIMIILILLNLSLSSFLAGILLLIFMLILAHIKYVPRLREVK
ncbi:MAG: hypothetical protein ACP5H8_02555 [Candidatus Micrarchaeia archaeon]